MAYPQPVADDWRVRVELPSEESRGAFSRLLGHELSPEGEVLARALEGRHLAVSGQGGSLFVYADTSGQAEAAHALIRSELRHQGLGAAESAVEHWLAGEERWDNEPAGDGWEADGKESMRSDKRGILANSIEITNLIEYKGE